MKKKTAKKMTLKKATIVKINANAIAMIQGGTRTFYDESGRGTHCADAICY